MHRMTMAFMVSALLTLPVGAQPADTADSTTPRQTVSVASTYARGNKGYAEAVGLLTRLLACPRKDADLNWMCKLDLEASKWIEVIYARTVSKPAPDRFVLEGVLPAGLGAEPGDQWSAKVCMIYPPSQTRLKSVEGPYDLTWSYTWQCRNDACRWEFDHFSTLKADSCDADSRGIAASLDQHDDSRSAPVAALGTTGVHG